MDFITAMFWLLKNPRASAKKEPKDIKRIDNKDQPVDKSKSLNANWSQNGNITGIITIPQFILNQHLSMILSMIHSIVQIFSEF